MKNMIDICKDFGIEIPAEKHAEFNKAVAENYKTIAEHERKVNRLTDDLAAEKKRADTAEETLKGFEGKDFDAIIKDRDEWKRKHDENEEKHRKEQEEREYNDDLEQAAKEAKCIDVKGASAHLDHETLRKSRNRKADIKAAFDGLRSSNGYLFEDNGGAARFTGQRDTGNTGALTRKDIMAIRDPAERQAKIAANMNLFQKG